MQEFNWSYGERIRQFRKVITNMTQDEFSVELGVSRQTINAYERDRQVPPMSMMETMCEKYNVSPVWLLTGTGNMQDTRYTKSPGDEDKTTSEQKTLANYIMADAKRASKLTRMLMDGGLKNL